MHKIFSCTWYIASCTCIMAFKLPSLKPKPIDCSGLPLYDFQLLINKEEIGKGNYSAVLTAGWPGNDAERPAGKFVVKKMLGEDILDKKNFVKEARIVQKLKHPNIVQFKGICSNPFALILHFKTIRKHRIQEQI